jgi:hypothetical protein
MLANHVGQKCEKCGRVLRRPATGFRKGSAGICSCGAKVTFANDGAEKARASLTALNNAMKGFGRHR